MSSSTPDTGGEIDIRAHIEAVGLKVGMFDNSGGTLNLARDTGDRRASEDLTDHELGFFRRRLKAVWHTTFERMNRNRRTRQALDEITKTGNLYENENGNLSSRDAENAMIDRMTSEIEGTVSKSAGEKSNIILDTSEGGKVIKDKIFELFKTARDEGLGRADFEEMATLMMQGINATDSQLFSREKEGTDKQILSQAIDFASNLWDIKETVNLALDHGMTIDEIRAETQVFAGVVKSGARTEAKRDLLDKGLEKLNNKEFEIIGHTVVKGAIVATGVAASVGAINWVSRKGMMTAAVFTGGFAGVAAARGMSRGWRKANIERAQDARDAAHGKVEGFPNISEIDVSTASGRMRRRFIEKSIERRKAMANTRYAMMGAADQTALLEGYIDGDTGALDVADQDEYQLAMANLGLAWAADEISNAGKADLISYSSIDTLDRERNDLYMARGTLQTRLREKYHEMNPGATDDFDTAMESIKAYWSAFHIEVDVTEKDELFKKLRRRSMGASAGISAVMGALIGAGIQEGAAHLQDAPSIPGSGAVDAVFESGGDKLHEAQTFLSGLIDHDHGAPTEVLAPESDLVPAPATTASFHIESPQQGAGTFNFEAGEFANIDTPGGYSFEPVPSSIVGGEAFKLGTDVDGEHIDLAFIQVDASGELTPASVNALTDLGAIDTPSDLQVETLSGESRRVEIGDNQYVNIPEEYQAVSSGDGSVEILDASGSSLGMIELDANGVPTDSILENASNQTVVANQYQIDSDPTTMTSTIEEYWDNSETEKVRRVGWYGNNTPSPEHELNELRTYPGGENGQWFDSERNVVIRLKMTDDGSFQGDDRAIVSELVASGDLNASLSLTSGVESQVKNFTFTEEVGTGYYITTIDKDHPLVAGFGERSSGNNGLNGMRLEISESTGVMTENNAEEIKILGTLVGNGEAPTITQTIQTTELETVFTVEPGSSAVVQEHNFTLGEVVVDEQPTPAIPAEVIVDEVIHERQVNPLVSLPVYAQTGMARMSNRENSEHGAEGGRESATIRYGDRSPRLVEDPQAELVTETEVAWYMSLVERHHDATYLQEVRDAADSDSSFSPDLINDTTEAIVPIQVSAVEYADKIYETLSLYGRQEGGVLDKTNIVLHLDWTDAEFANPDGQRAIQKTRDEIQRAQDAFPDLRITLIEKEWDPALIADGSTMEDLATRRLYDTTMALIERAMNSGRMDAGRDPLILGSTMQVNGVDRSYIDKMLKRAGAVARADAFTGATRIQTEDYDDYPGLGAVANLEAILDRLSTQRTGRNVSTAKESNAGFRASSFAAVGGRGFDAEASANEAGYRLNAARDRRNPSPDKLFNASTGAINSVDLLSGEETGDFGDEAKPITAVYNANVDTRDAEFVTEYLRGAERDGRDVAVKENIRKDEDMAIVAERYEKAVSKMLTQKYRDLGVARIALTLALRGKDKDGNDNYELTASNGRVNFSLTESGKTHLKNNLLRRRGKMMPIGARTRLGLYSIKKGAAKTEAKREVARLLRRGEHPGAG